MSWFTSLIKPFVGGGDSDNKDRRIDGDNKVMRDDVTRGQVRGRGQPHPDTVVQRVRRGSESAAAPASHVSSSLPYTASSRSKKRRDTDRDSSNADGLRDAYSVAFLRLSAAERRRAENLGVSQDLLEFVGEIAQRPETWIDFPFEQVVSDAREQHELEQRQDAAAKVVAGDDGATSSSPLSPPQSAADGATSPNQSQDTADVRSASPGFAAIVANPWEPFELTPRRLEHALLMLELSEQLRALRYNMCPRHMDEDRFWRVYFALASHRLDKPHVDLLADMPVPATSRSVELTPDEDVSVWEFLTTPDPAAAAAVPDDDNDSGSFSSSHQSLSQSADSSDADDDDGRPRDHRRRGSAADRPSSSTRKDSLPESYYSKKQVLPVRDALPWELLAVDPDAYTATRWSDSDRDSARVWFAQVQQIDAVTSAAAAAAASSSSSSSSSLSAGTPVDQFDSLTFDGGDGLGGGDWQLLRAESAGSSDGLPSPPIALARSRLLLRHGFPHPVASENGQSTVDQTVRTAVIALAAVHGSSRALIPPPRRLFDLGRFAAVEARVFGPNVPQRCARVPAFGGYYRPDAFAHGRWLSAEEADAASRVLVMLAMELPEVTYAPALPDAVQLALVGTGGTRQLGASTVFAVFHWLLRSSRGAMARERQFAKQVGGQGGARALPLAADGPPLHFCMAPIEYRTMAAVLGELIRRALPELNAHMTRVRVEPADFADRWFKRLFVGAASPALCARVFALWLSEGLPALYAVAMALLRIHRAALLRCGNGDDFLNCLRALCAPTPPPGTPAASVDPERVLRAAFAVRLTRALVARLHDKHYARLQANRAAAAQSGVVGGASGGAGGHNHRPARASASSSHQHDQSSSSSSLLRRPWRRLARRSTSGSSTATPSDHSSGDQMTQGHPSSPGPTGTPTALRHSRVLTSTFYRPRILQLSSILSQEEFELIWAWLPDSFRTNDPVQVFSTVEHGVSINTLYKCCADVEPTLLILKTKLGDRLGAFLAQSWDTSETGYSGSGESFVFKLNDDTPERFCWRPGQESLFMMASRNFFAVGGNALRLDDELWQGRSEPGKTFNNPTLINHPKSPSDKYSFECVAVEVYTCDEND